jgi:hypothetical protein
MSSQPNRQTVDAVLQPQTTMPPADPTAADAGVELRHGQAPDSGSAPRRRADQRVAYVLWGDGFDEVMAVRLLTALRKLAIQSFLVGLRSQGMRGAYGITLVPNLTLDEGLAARHAVGWIVLPWPGESLRSLLTEPRLLQLLTAPANAPVALIVLRPALVEELCRLKAVRLHEQLRIYVCAPQTTEEELGGWLMELNLPVIVRP